MQYIGTVQGLFLTNSNVHFCRIQIGQGNVDVFIPPLSTLFAFPGDIVTLGIFPPSLWKLSLCDKIQFLDGPFNSSLFFSTQNFNSIFDVFLALRTVENKRLIPVGCVTSINQMASLDACSGYVENNIFYPDDRNFPVWPAPNTYVEFRRVLGVYNRQAMSFEVQNGSKEKNFNRESDMEIIKMESESLKRIKFDFPCVPITNATPLISFDTKTEEIRKEEPLKEIFNVDLRNRRVFTIDHRTTRIRDDALHVCYVGPNLIEFGVHCTDFTEDLSVEEFTHLFNQRQKESGHTFNQKICEKLSLDCGKTLHAFSILFYVNTTTCRVEQCCFGKSVIRVQANLTTDQFTRLSTANTVDDLKVFNGLKTSQMDLERICSDSKLLSEITEKVLCLYIAKNTVGQGDVIADLGKFVGRCMGEQLHQYYGDLALLRDYRPWYYRTTFRSPLRKLFDICVLRQIEAMNCKYGVEQMVITVCGTAERLQMLIDEQKILPL
ncbi:hypothetical protein EIN_096100 [Entamoeba invadens IP1]|uniref:RNB domain-containing protein n=1 Tax=Entamoeba invadens IP1 TaxID=370355 RepID=A0A0A1U3P7_ENTIV|nr:hypothetical protein EIN_096100 [Entamoeba invadens IP1]ELP87353.1 hypothetical protein EIN_096100 [Entamoeba invadens IP1]|eukprot:XP_004254124.1 hypothetical protein EIN_096100 [Entamoeba invadens IP1]